MESSQYQTVSTSNIEGVGVYACVCCYPQHLLQTFECTPVTLAVGTMIVLPLVYKKCRPILKIWCCHGREMHLHRETVGNIRWLFFSNLEGLTFQSFIEATVALVRSGDPADLSCFQVFFTHSACHLHAQLAVLSLGSDLAPNAITE